MQLRRLQAIGEREGVEFAAGHVTIVPPLEDDNSSDSDYRVIYTSWDGLRTRDLSQISRADFLNFMRSEPGGMIEALGKSAGRKV